MYVPLKGCVCAIWNKSTHGMGFRDLLRKRNVARNQALKLIMADGLPFK